MKSSIPACCCMTLKWSHESPGARWSFSKDDPPRPTFVQKALLYIMQERQTARANSCSCSRRLCGKGESQRERRDGGWWVGRVSVLCREILKSAGDHEHHLWSCHNLLRPAEQEWKCRCLFSCPWRVGCSDSYTPSITVTNHTSTFTAHHFNTLCETCYVFIRLN